MKLKKKDLSFDRLDISSASADLVIACNVLFMVENLIHLFLEVERVLKPGGYFGFNISTHKIKKSGTIMKKNSNTSNVEFYVPSNYEFETMLEKMRFITECTRIKKHHHPGVGIDMDSYDLVCRKK